MVTPRVGEETPRLDNEEEEEENIPHGDDEGEDASDGLGEAVDGNADEAEGVRLYTIVVVGVEVDDLDDGINGEGEEDDLGVRGRPREIR